MKKSKVKDLKGYYQSNKCNTQKTIIWCGSSAFELQKHLNHLVSNTLNHFNLPNVLELIEQIHTIKPKCIILSGNADNFYNDDMEVILTTLRYIGVPFISFVLDRGQNDFISISKPSVFMHSWLKAGFVTFDQDKFIEFCFANDLISFSISEPTTSDIDYFKDKTLALQEKVEGALLATTTRVNTYCNDYFSLKAKSVISHSSFAEMINTMHHELLKYRNDEFDFPSIFLTKASRNQNVNFELLLPVYHKYANNYLHKLMSSMSQCIGESFHSATSVVDGTICVAAGDTFKTHFLSLVKKVPFNKNNNYCLCEILIDFESSTIPLFIIIEVSNDRTINQN
ncbi:hypothetical protein EIJ81_00745 (plasmid) [Aliivibrio salmonicida]|uniref:hypothetical protein n=1 Tax=Aliivibrio salmonicida TaxID=40269 RepID=UPI000F6C44EF|nr:hypothetical protein [Aliivibrio salmonicida]AZL83427.1 hypothetical protein EIJ81_00745 [Aliivibrio salmonicida]